MNNNGALIIPEEVIMNKIYIVRKKKIMLDLDLAELYGIPTFRLNEKVKRNSKRFPRDFMFRLTEKEKSEVIAFCDNLARLKFSPHLPFAFTEHGAVMLASILNSDRAIAVNIQIVRVYTKMRQLIENHSEILRKLDELQRNDSTQDKQILLIFEYLKQLEQAKKEDQRFKERKRIGFKRSEEG